MKGKEYSYPVKAYIYLVHLLCSKYDGKFKSVGCNKFTLFPILGVERSFPWLQLGKVSAILGKLQLGKVSVILGKERILSWKGKDPFLSQERSSLQLGKVSAIWERWER